MTAAERHAKATATMTSAGRLKPLHVAGLFTRKAERPDDAAEVA